MQSEQTDMSSPQLLHSLVKRLLTILPQFSHATGVRSISATTVSAICYPSSSWKPTHASAPPRLLLNLQGHLLPALTSGISPSWMRCTGVDGLPFICCYCSQLSWLVSTHSSEQVLQTNISVPHVAHGLMKRYEAGSLQLSHTAAQSTLSGSFVCTAIIYRPIAWYTC